MESPESSARDIGSVVDDMATISLQQTVHAFELQARANEVRSQLSNTLDTNQLISANNRVLGSIAVVSSCIWKASLFGIETTRAYFLELRSRRWLPPTEPKG